MLPELIAKLGLDNSAFERGLRSASAQAQDFGRNVGKSIGGALGPLTTVLTGAGIAGFLKSLADGAEEIVKSSKNLGVSTDFFQGFTDAAEKSGVSADTASTAIAKLSVKVGEARDGNEEAAKAFQRLGIALTDAQGNIRSTEDVLLDISNRFAAIPDATERARLAVDLFGRSGVELSGFLSQGSEAIRQLVADADKINSESLQNIIQAKKQIEDFFQAITVFAGNAIGLVGKYYQILGSLSVRISEIKIGSGFSDSVRKVIEGIKTDLASLEAKPTEIKVKAVTSNAQLERQKKLIEELQKAEADRFAQSLSDSDRLAELERQRVETAAELAKTGVDTEDSVKKRTELTKEVTRLEKEIASTQEKVAQSIQKQLDGQRQLLKAQNDLLTAQRDLNTAKEDRSKFTIQELADSRVRFSGLLAEEQRIARQIVLLRQRAEINRKLGFTDTSIAQNNLADQLAKGLKNVVEKDREPFKSMEDNIKKQTEALLQLVAKLDQDRAAAGQPPLVPQNQPRTPQPTTPAQPINLQGFEASIARQEQAIRDLLARLPAVTGAPQQVTPQGQTRPFDFAGIVAQLQGQLNELSKLRSAIAGLADAAKIPATDLKDALGRQSDAVLSLLAQLANPPKAETPEVTVNFDAENEIADALALQLAALESLGSSIEQLANANALPFETLINSVERQTDAVLTLLAQLGAAPTATPAAPVVNVAAPSLEKLETELAAQTAAIQSLVAQFQPQPTTGDVTVAGVTAEIDAAQLAALEASISTQTEAVLALVRTLTTAPAPGAPEVNVTSNFEQTERITDLLDAQLVAFQTLASLITQSSDTQQTQLDALNANVGRQADAILALLARLEGPPQTIAANPVAPVVNVEPVSLAAMEQNIAQQTAAILDLVSAIRGTPTGESPDINVAPQLDPAQLSGIQDSIETQTEAVLQLVARLGAPAGTGAVPEVRVTSQSSTSTLESLMQQQVDAVNTLATTIKDSTLNQDAIRQLVASVREQQSAVGNFLKQLDDVTARQTQPFVSNVQTSPTTQARFENTRERAIAPEQFAGLIQQALQFLQDGFSEQSKSLTREIGASTTKLEKLRNLPLEFARIFADYSGKAVENIKSIATPPTQRNITPNLAPLQEIQAQREQFNQLVSYSKTQAEQITRLTDAATLDQFGIKVRPVNGK